MLLSPFDARVLPSLSDEPQLYPDARRPAAQPDFAYRSGRVYPLRSPLDPPTLDTWLQETGAVGFRGRIALLAVGSNAYPRQLHDKLHDTPADAEGLITVCARVAGLDIAYCPIRARKGYVPVTLASRPGVVRRTWLQWLTPAQLEVISATEGSRYTLVGGRPLAALVTLAPQLPKPDHVYAWWFDSLLSFGARRLWLDEHEQSDVWRRFSSLDSVSQSPPSDWTIVDRARPNWPTRIAPM